MEAETVATNNGRRVYPRQINTICPVEHAAIVRGIAYRHLIEVEGSTNESLASMLPVNLGPVGGDTVTHVRCSRVGYTHQVNMEVDTIRQQPFPWCANKGYVVGHDVAEMKSLFCCITGDQAEVLAYLGLERK